MTEAHETPSSDEVIENKAVSKRPAKLLSLSAKSWLVVAALGQWIFAAYVTAFYFPRVFGSGPAGLADTHLPNGYVAGDAAGNLAISGHVVIAAVIIGLGPLQLVPKIRMKAPRFHRIVGRIYVATAILTSIAGLYLVLTRGTLGGWVGHTAISLDAILIISFACIAVYHAIKRNFLLHETWVLRLFMVVSAVWFFRIGIMAWFITTGGVGIDTETFSGPFLTFLFFGQMAVPLLVLEMYLRARRSKHAGFKYLTAATIGTATILTAIGILAATMFMWVPRL